MPPETKYARLGGDRIAYQVLGEGPADLVLVRRSYGHIDIAWRTLGSACSFEGWRPSAADPVQPARHGAPSGLPLGPLPLRESMAEEPEAVQDEVGSERAAIMAELDAGPTALLFAGTRRNGPAP